MTEREQLARLLEAAAQAVRAGDRLPNGTEYAAVVELPGCAPEYGAAGQAGDDLEYAERDATTGRRGSAWGVFALAGEVTGE